MSTFPGTAAELPAECRTFTWDVARELAVLSTEATPVAAGDGASAASPRIEPGKLYRARLLPQDRVRLAAPPGKPMLDDGAHAGLLVFQVPGAGRYRASITTGHWIDIADDGRIVPSLDFQGRPGCPLVHKIVEFELPAGRDLVLQFTGGVAPQADVLITPVPPSP